jgi:Cu(I)/Ag(I) efflux system membrane fusion protein
MKNNLKTYIIAGLILVLGVFLGATLFSSESQQEDEHAHEQGDDAVWTCSMHPQIRQDEPGDCPICGMDLIPANKMEDDVDPDAIKMSKTARKLAKVETTTVGEEASKSSMNFSGRLEINQDNTSSISANFKARIERLYINEEGEEVQKGQVIAELYAPEIQVLKDELVLATRQGNDVLLKSITRKIKNYELSVSDIQSLKNARLKLRSPKNGVISSLNVKQGDNVKADQNLMRIADLSTLWAILDVYESDLNRINEGDELRVSIPNEDHVTGKVTFVSPVLDANSRSAKARVVIQNPKRNLKPGVFITAELMNTESELTENQVLMLPKSAVLWTGKRSVVYQQLENENGVYFKMKEVKTGGTSSGFVEILSGLEAGDEVVTRGAFSIDSEAQLSDKPSMMNHQEQSIDNASLLKDAELNPVEDWLNDYLELKNSLVDDDFSSAQKHYKTLLMKLFKDEKVVMNKQNIQQLRNDFVQLNDHLIPMIKEQNTNQKLYVQFCPMANDSNGAQWLSKNKAIKNPYYGASMLTCGSVQDSIN